MSAKPIHTACRIIFLLLIAHLCFGQHATQTSVPLGDMLSRALQQSSLTGKNAKPFHIKVHILESTNADSPYQADLEEYWESPQQWRRSIDSEKFKQTLGVNDAEVNEQNTGDYYPLWLRNFVTAIFDPVPNADQWNQPGMMVNQITFPNGKRSIPCARIVSKLGSATVVNSVFSNICFNEAGLLSLVNSPGYGMEFGHYAKFGNQMIARQYIAHPESGTELVGSVVLLEELKNSDPALFSIAHATPPEERIQVLRVDQATIERAAEGQPALVFPRVSGGKTSGVLSMYISVDRDGRVREAYPLNADNPSLQDTARDQLKQWKLKPMVSKGVPVQVEAGMTFRFGSSSAEGAPHPESSAVPPENPATPKSVRVSKGVFGGMLVYHPGPVYPPEAKVHYEQGIVDLGVTIDRQGNTKDIRVISAPSQALADAAVAAVRQWRYRPYELNGSPVEVESSVEVNFKLP